jgi:hypothetical protein
MIIFFVPPGEVIMRPPRLGLAIGRVDIVCGIEAVMGVVSNQTLSAEVKAGKGDGVPPHSPGSNMITQMRLATNQSRKRPRVIGGAPAFDESIDDMSRTQGAKIRGGLR